MEGGGPEPKCWPGWELSKYLGAASGSAARSLEVQAPSSCQSSPPGEKPREMGAIPPQDQQGSVLSPMWGSRGEGAGRGPKGSRSTSVPFLWHLPDLLTRDHSCEMTTPGHWAETKALGLA